MRRGLSVLVCVLAVMPGVGHVAAQAGEQEILGPGLYIYQTRITGATCNDATQTGFVNSYVATIDGIPRSPSMEMTLTNSEYWKTWDITVRNGTIVGEARVRNRSAHFEVRRRGSRFTGTGHRIYQSTVDGNRMRCRIEFDALLRRVDV